jgi:hypothetical protein
MESLPFVSRLIGWMGSFKAYKTSEKCWKKLAKNKESF